MSQEYVARFRKARARAGERSIATKILDLMDILRNTKDNKQSKGSERRWVWELLQNACDASYKNRKIAIEINFKESNGEGILEFKHSGKPFTSDDITFLIEQVSNKDRDDSTQRERKPHGKFGTGFLTTHLLSEKVEVEGVLKEDGLDYRKFSITLDRSGRKLSEVIESVKRSSADFEDIGNRPPLSDFVETALNTTFRYKLDQAGIRVAKAGILDMQQAIPYTLAFLPEIEKVNLISLGEEYILDRTDPIGDDLEIVTIRKDCFFDEVNIQIAIVRKDDVSIAVEIEATEGGTAIKCLDSELPSLFCDFPLVGSGAFRLPVVINCPTFNPNEPRNGIWLTDANQEKVNENKAKIDIARELFVDVLQFAAKNNWRNTVNLFRIFPVIEMDWLSAEWFHEEVLTPIRQELLTIPLVDVEILGHTAIFDENGDINVFFASSNNAEVRKLIWDLAISLKPLKLPPKPEVHQWAEVLWDECPQITVEALTNDIQKEINISTLAKYFSGSETNALKWLTSYYELLNMEPETLRLINDDRYAVIPNQMGDFKLRSKLRIGTDIEEELKNVLEILGTGIRNGLVHKQAFTGENIEYDVLNNDTVIEQINKQLAVKGTDDKTMQACYYLTSLFPPQGSYPAERTALYNFSTRLLPDKISAPKGLKNYDAEIWKESDKMLAKAMVRAISQHNNVETLVSALKFRASVQALKWLDQFVSFLLEHDLESQLNLKNNPILPNQCGEFIIKDSVFLDSGDIAEELKDISADLGYDFRESLLDCNIYLVLAENRTIDKAIVADKIIDLVQPKLSELSRSEQTKDAFRRLFIYFSKHREESAEIFGDLFNRKHRLYDDEEIANNLEKAGELEAVLLEYNVADVEELKKILSDRQSVSADPTPEKMEITQEALAALGITSKADLEKAIAGGSLGDYFHISTPTIEMYEYARDIIDRSKRNIIEEMRLHPDYNLDEMEELAPTILAGITHDGIPVYIVIRPSDNGMVLIHYPSEKDTLDFTHAELWVDDGVHSPKHLTFGKILKITGINKIPVHGLY